MTDTVPMLPTATTTDAASVHAAVAVLPVGSFEQHGPCLPLVTDTLIATAIAASIVGHHRNVFQLPAIAYGCSHEHAAFPSTVSISATTLSAVIADIAESCAQQGITALIIINAHGGNAVLTIVAQQANVHGPLRVGLYPSREDWAEARTAARITSSNHDDMHAGELETSVLLAAYPDYVRDGWNTPRRTRSSLHVHSRHQRLHRHRRHWPSQATKEKDWVPLTTSAPQPEPSLACSRTDTRLKRAPWRLPSAALPSATTDQSALPPRAPPSKSSERRCENFLYCYQDRH